MWRRDSGVDGRQKGRKADERMNSEERGAKVVENVLTFCIHIEHKRLVEELHVNRTQEPQSSVHTQLSLAYIKHEDFLFPLSHSFTLSSFHSHFFIADCLTLIPLHSSTLRYFLHLNILMLPATTMSSGNRSKPMVLIVGAGLGGLLLGALLEKAGVPYKIVERTSVVKPLGMSPFIFDPFILFSLTCYFPFTVFTP